MVVPGVALVGRELTLGPRSAQFYQTSGLGRVGTFDVQFHRVVAIDLIGFHITLKFAFDTP